MSSAYLTSLPIRYDVSRADNVADMRKLRD